MKAIKRRISLLLAGLMVAGAVSTMPVKAEEAKMPAKPVFQQTTGYVVAGNQQSVFVTSDFDGEVQYNVWYYDADGVWTETGYGEAVDPKIPTEVKIDADAKAGTNWISVWVKRAGVADADTANPKADGTGGYDSFSYRTITALEEGYQIADIDYTLNGSKLVVNGVKDAKDGVEYKVYLQNVMTGEWVNVQTEWTAEKVEFTAEPGQYYLNVQVNDPNYVREGEAETKWDAWRLTRINVEEKAGVTVDFTTTLEAKNFGTQVTVNSESDAVAKYNVVFKGKEKFKAPIAIGEGSLVVPGPKAGEMLKVKFFDAAGMLLETVEVKAGEAGSFVVEEKEQKEYAVEVTTEAKNFGSKVTATCDDEDVAKYNVVFKGKEKFKAPIAIGEGSLVVPAPKVGDTVTIKLYDASGALLADVEKTIK